MAEREINIPTTSKSNANASKNRYLLTYVERVHGGDLEKSGQTVYSLFRLSTSQKNGVRVRRCPP
jgi:hypothetical protein